VISICIPTYEQTDFLNKLMESIVFQDYCNYEVVISDDSKSTVVRDLIHDKYGPLLGDKLRYFHNEPALGSPANWNNAIGLARYDVVKIMHHDDYFSGKDSLSKIFSQFQKYPDVNIVFTGGYTSIGDDKREHTTNDFKCLKICKG
jgi:glycosyltransferase involved in cell wall biosynthesis